MSAVHPSHGRGAAVTEELFRAAIDLIGEQGPALSIEDVARAAGVNKTTA